MIKEIEPVEISPLNTVTKLSRSPVAILPQFIPESGNFFFNPLAVFKFPGRRLRFRLFLYGKHRQPDFPAFLPRISPKFIHIQTVVILLPGPDRMSGIDGYRIELLISDGL
jgi:hypothetical protein